MGFLPQINHFIANIIHTPHITSIYRKGILIKLLLQVRFNMVLENRSITRHLIKHLWKKVIIVWLQRNETILSRENVIIDLENVRK